MRALSFERGVSVTRGWVRGLVALGVVTVAAPVGALQPHEIRQNLFASCFLNEHEGWIVGELGRVFHTADGGRTFTQMPTKTKTPLVSIACFPDKTLFVTGQGGTIMRSRDGGATWERLTTGSERHLLSLAFASPQVGVAVGDFGTILRTEDGGATWAPIAIPPNIPLPEEIAETIDPADILLYDVDFVDPEHGWIVGEFGVVFTTADGGRTWSAQQSPVSTTLFAVDFVDPSNGWAAGLESVLLRTTDGGATWVPQDIPVQKGFVLSLYDVAVVGQIGWAVGDSGMLLHSTDGGATWARAELPIQLAANWFRGVSLTPAGRGFIVGSEGMMLATERDRHRQIKQAS
jgi:photosystem II stability/assembly factor-like uncharacterized protein